MSLSWISLAAGLTTLLVLWLLIKDVLSWNHDHKKHQQLLHAWIELDQERMRHYRLCYEAMRDGRKAESEWHLRMWERLGIRSHQAYEDMKKWRMKHG